MTTNVTTDKPFAGFAPGEHRKLLTNVHRWAHTNGWHWHECWGWVNAPYASEATVGVDWDPDVRTITVRRNDGSGIFRPTTYPTDSVRQAVDLLVAVGILPAQFSSAYAAGWHDGYFATAEDETAAEIRASWADREQVTR